MEPITGAEIEGVRGRCLREPINIADDDHTHATLDEILTPAMRALPPVHTCQAVFEQLLTVLIMGLGIGARVSEERALGLPEAERATDLAERYGEAILKIGAALVAEDLDQPGRIMRARGVIAGLEIE